VAIWIIDMPAQAVWTLPAASAGLNRTLYFFAGDQAELEQSKIKVKQALRLVSEQAVTLTNQSQPARFLLLQGRPINEPVQQHGPFVMNTRQELQQAFMDYQRTQFGGWPWERADQVHGTEIRRFAKFADGTVETP
jgi:redox-sensitive bicupin YhaK (pirin superfamily)